MNLPFQNLPLTKSVETHSDPKIEDISIVFLQHV